MECGGWNRGGNEVLEGGECTNGGYREVTGQPFCPHPCINTG